MLSVRRATLDDREAMVSVYVAAWREGFRHMFSDGTFARSDFDADRRAECIETTLTSDTDTFVAEHDGHVAGFSVSRRDLESVILDDIWVHPTWWGFGGAAALVSRVEDDARAEGVARMAGWVPEDSPRARHFAEKIGWRATGRIEELALYQHEPNRMFEYERVLALFDMTRGLPRPTGAAVEMPFG